MPTILERTPLTNGFLKVQRLQIQEGEQQYQYEFLEKKSAAAILVVDKTNESVILVRQWRPIDNGTYVTECVAGLIDENETPISTAIKEVHEEIGYQITESELQYFGEKMVSPGCMGEKFHLFIAYVNQYMNVHAGGGLLEEHEQIEVIRMPITEFLSSEMLDMKTAYLQLALKLSWNK